MKYAAFIRKQLQWAKRHGESTEDTQRATWWLARIKELEKLEAKTFPTPPPAAGSQSSEHPGESSAA